MNSLLPILKKTILLLLVTTSLCYAQIPPTCAVNLPYTEGFNAATISSCWSQAVISSTTANGAITAVSSGSNPTTSPYEGTYMLRFNAYNASSGVQTRIMSSPFNTTDIASIDVEYYWYLSSSGSQADKVQLQYSLNGTTWVNAGAEVPRYATTSAWVKKSVTLPTAAANQPKVYIAFLFTSAYGYNCYLDNVSIKKSATCFPGTMAVTQNITSSSASINWTAPSTAPASGYEYYVSTSATAPAAATSVTGSTAAGVTTAALTNLAANTPYYAWVRSNCGNGDKSEWTATAATFTTACGAVNAPYTQNFDGNSAIPGCSTVQDVNADNKTWAIQTSSTYASSGNNSLRYPYGSSTANDWWFTPGINMVAGNMYKVTFAYRAYGSNYPEALEVKTGTAQSAAGMSGNVLFSNSAITNSTFQTATVTYTPTTTGVQYFGWHATSTTSGFYLYVDDISITLLPDCGTITFPSSVTAQASKSSICSSESISFSLTGTIPQATGITYRWKSSADGITYANVGAASSMSSVILAVNENNRWFKCDVMCKGTVVLTSAPIEISINVSILSVTSGNRCGLGTVQLSATTQAGNMVKWYESADSNMALGNGTTFNTPQIAHTTTYYAVASGLQSIISAGPVSPQNVSTSYGTYNNGYATIFNVSQATLLQSVTIYPADQQDNNVIILKNASGTILTQYTFSTLGAPVSETTGISAPFIVNLGWEIPAGTGYQLEWKYVSFNGANMVIRNNSGGSAFYNRNYNGITFTGNNGGASNADYWFYFYDWKFTTGCGESAIRVPVTATVNYEWTGAQDTNWNNPANWCGGAVPTAVDAITVPHTAVSPKINAGNIAFANTLNIGNGAALNVATGATLRLANALTVADNATVTVEDNGSLVQLNDVTNQGKITLHKKANPLYRLDYTMWSSPVSGQNILNFSPQTLASRFYEYKYANNGTSWIEGYWAVDAANASFETGKGYLIRMPNTVENASGYTTGDTHIFTGTFTGAPNNGTLNIPLSMEHNRFTAVGNPYPSPVSVADFFTANLSKLATDTGIYLWRKRNNATSSSYATLTRAGLVANPSGNAGSDQQIFYGGLEDNWMIAPGQGFIVKTATTAVTAPALTFTNSMRRNAQGSTQGFFRQVESNASKVWLNVTGIQGDASQTAIAYLNNTTNDIDYGYDGKMLSDAATVSLYSVAVDTKLAIQARPAFNIADVVNLGFSAPNAGQYTISIDHTEGVFANGQKVYLKDNAEGIIRSLNERSYTFTSEAGTFDSRFELVYQTTALGTDIVNTDANSVVVYKDGNTLFIDGGSVLLNNVTLYDMQGREVHRLDTIDNIKAAINNLAVQQQVLAVIIDTEKGRVTRKIIF